MVKSSDRIAAIELQWKAVSCSGAVQCELDYPARPKDPTQGQCITCSASAEWCSSQEKV